MEMKRRKFIKGSLAAAGMISAPGLSMLNGQIPDTKDPMPMNPLGSTGVMVSKLGYGCPPFGWDTLTQDDVDRLVTRAVELGINYFDTAPNYRVSEERMGKIIPSVRDKIFLVTK